MISAAINRKKLIDTKLFLPSWNVKKTSLVTQYLDVSAKAINKAPTSISPPKDQICIPNLLTRAENLIAKRKENIKALDVLLKSTFLEMFGDPVKNEKGWEKENLGDLTDLITDGKHGDSINEENFGYYFISAKNIHDGIIDYSNARQITKKDFDEVHSRTNLCSGDLVIVNTGATIGKLAFATDDAKTRKTPFQKSVAVVKLKKGILERNYLKFLLGLSIRNLVKTSSGSAQQNLLLSQMRKISIILPPNQLQPKYGVLVDKTECLKNLNIKKHE